jgi:urocanate hydratase
MNALGVSQYGQMTASYMYIGPQGIVHGTTITNGFRKIKRSPKAAYVTSGLEAECSNQSGNIAGCITVCAEVNPKNTHSSQSRMDQVIEECG